MDENDWSAMDSCDSSAHDQLYYQDLPQPDGIPGFQLPIFIGYSIISFNITMYIPLPCRLCQQKHDG